MKLSVVITTYNRPDYLEVSLQSVLKQSEPVDEIIIVDDNSSADYQSVLNAFSSAKIRYIKLKESSGANAARNKGVKLASGEVVAFLDDDDVWTDNYLSRHVLAYSDGADAVVSGFKHLGNETQIRVNPDVKVTKRSLVKGNKYCGMSGFSCKRELLLKNEFDISLNNGQDWDMYVRLYLQKINFINVPEAIFLYRFQTADGIGAKLRKLKPSDIETRLGSARKHREFLGEYWFKQRVAEQLLVSLSHRDKKISWIAKSLEMIGFKATIQFVLRTVKRKLRC